MSPEDATRRHTNRLARATSPYLLQHAHNPVDWYEWGPEALARARAEDRPILLSIGYSACHWCHVMERESFEDEGIAEAINRAYVAIKVDREERPDLDAIYMAATVALNDGQGGWPMTVFLTPAQEPFFAGTYFPPEDRGGRPGLLSVLTQIAEAWQADRARIGEQGRQLLGILRAGARAAPGTAIGEADLRRALVQLTQEFDARWGGFGPAPKFPPATVLLLLLRLHRRFGDSHALEMAVKTLDGMAEGGLFDQVGGGFHRYSTDEHWLVPHFEKMLCDQALLTKAYLEAYQVTGTDTYRRVATEVLDYVQREMTSLEGGYSSSADADSEGQEGAFFAWTPEEIAAVLGPTDGRVFCEYYDITDRGNWEGRSIPNLTRTGTRVASRLGLSAEDLEGKIAGLRARVYEARQARVAPARDETVLAGWNGLMIGAMAEGARVLGEARFLEGARRAADFVTGTLSLPDGRLRRAFRAGRAGVAAYLEDYACLAEGLVDLYEAGGGEAYLDRAVSLCEHVVADFAAEGGGFFRTSAAHERLILRPRDGHDSALPSANATAAHVLARLSFHLGREVWREAALGALRAFGRAIARAPRAFGKSLIVADLLLEGPVELALVGRRGSRDTQALAAELGRHFMPCRVIEHGDPDRPAGAERPLLVGKGLVDGRAALYVCRDFACEAPVTDPGAVAGALASHVRDAGVVARVTVGEGQAGRATPAGTAAYAGRSGAARAGYVVLGRTGLLCSRIGFGAYRVEDETAEHHQALSLALTSGCNLVDTSSNYTDGGSETLVGEVLEELLGDGTLRRDEVIVVSKLGYVQGENLALAEEREEAGRPFPEMVKYGDGIWHCIHPELLADQLGRSLGRLQLGTLDFCLLHNPEYFLKDALERSHGTLEERREELDGRLGAAFAFLEREVKAGRIGAYGISSNTFGAAADDPEHLSLTRALEVAREVAGGDHHFQLVQVPLNLMEPDAARVKNNGADESDTVLETAAREGLGVLVNRPLNAIAGEGAVRLAVPMLLPAEVDFDLQRAALAELEEEYRRVFAPLIRTSDDQVRAEDLFRWSVELGEMPARLSGVEQWDGIESQGIRPQVISLVRALDQAMGDGPGAESWASWRERYLTELAALLAELRRQAVAKSRERAFAVAAAIDAHLPPERRGESLARKALWVAASTPGVSAVLCGMRRVRYVEDAVGILPWPLLPDVAAVYEAAGAAFAAR